MLRRSFAVVLAFGWIPLAHAQEAESGIDAAINAIIAPVANAVATVIFFSIPVAGVDLPLIVVWLGVAAAFFTIYFGFINLRSFGHAFQLLRGTYTDPRSAGEISHFQALATALSGTVGLGNIAGVAVAISLGGPGATVWMIVMGLLGMSSKFVECTLGVKYRIENEDGSVSGGAMRYLSRNFERRGMPGFGKFLAAFFALMIIGAAIGGGNMFQVNQAYQQVVAVTGEDASFFADKAWLFGIIVAALVGIVTIGGVKRIASVTDKLVPGMAIIYLFAGFLVLIIHYDRIPSAIGEIIGGAFSPEGVAGGFVGALVQGIRRATFSNEAGIGTAAIAHSAVKTDEPITEGIVALHEPFIDTVVICTMTALVIVVSGVYEGAGDISGVQLTSQAFGSALPWFPLVLALAVVLFAFSTILAYSYYIVLAGNYLFGRTPRVSLIMQIVFIIFTILGATMSLGAVVDFSDAMLFACSIPNIIGLYWFASEVKADYKSYMRRLRAGEFPRFK